MKIVTGSETCKLLQSSLKNKDYSTLANDLFCIFITEENHSPVRKAARKFFDSLDKKTKRLIERAA